MRYTISPATAAFSPVSVNLVAETAEDLILLTNLFGGVPRENATDQVNNLAGALRVACDTGGISKDTRKTSVGYNWGKKLREMAAQLSED